MADTNVLGQEQIPVVVPLGRQQQSNAIVVRPRPHPQSSATQGDSLMMTKTQGGNAMMRTRKNDNNAMMRTESGGNAMMRIESGNNAMMTTESGGNPMMITENSGNAMMTTENTGNAMMTTESSGNAMQNNLMMMNTQGLMNIQGGNVMTTSRNELNNMQNSEAMMNTQDINPMTTTRNGKFAASTNPVVKKSGIPRMNTQDNAAMMNTQGGNTMMAAEINVHPTKKTRVLYYDPSVGIETVYDADGTPILLSSLQTDNTEIYLEKPLLGATEQNAPPLELDYEWGESQAQDQMIIVSTVATMALLVGALSARRLRSRQFLASCIENESLEDEVAYDTAYTTNGYDTFVGGGPWKGDLEKFDV